VLNEAQFDAASNALLIVMSPPEGEHKDLVGDKMVSVLDRILRKAPVGELLQSATMLCPSTFYSSEI
jgi:hypothetical protein